MELRILYFTVSDYKRTGIQLGDNYYITKGFIGDEGGINELYELIKAILKFKIEDEKEIIIDEEEFNEIHKEIVQEFEVEINPWVCATT